jgi:hypothetical protein
VASTCGAFGGVRRVEGAADEVDEDCSGEAMQSGHWFGGGGVTKGVRGRRQGGGTEERSAEAARAGLSEAQNIA